MADDLNPQAEQMADESMVRNLAAQADAIWPQERPLFDRYALPASPQLLDAGCGTGEISHRLCLHFPDARLLGVDLIDEHLALARARCASMGASGGRGATATRTRLATHTSISRETFNAQFNDMIATLEDPFGYGVWHVPVIAGRIP